MHITAWVYHRLVLSQPRPTIALSYLCLQLSLPMHIIAWAFHRLVLSLPYRSLPGPFTSWPITVGPIFVLSYHCLGLLMPVHITASAYHCLVVYTFWVYQYLGPSQAGPITGWAHHRLGQSILGLSRPSLSLPCPINVWVLSLPMLTVSLSGPIITYSYHYRILPGPITGSVYHWLGL
jgi:hypothetical protein